MIDHHLTINLERLVSVSSFGAPVRRPSLCLHLKCQTMTFSFLLFTLFLPSLENTKRGTAKVNGDT